MDRQKAVFLETEGDGYFTRNAGKLVPRGDDPVVEALMRLGIRARAALEIGAANGHRLVALHDAMGCNGAGIDPSAAAVEAGRATFPDIDLRVGTADVLPFADAAFDLVIFGFCLYLVDPALHFRAVAEADRVLADGGHLVMVDFLPPFPYANPYAHVPGLNASKHEYARMFTAHPSYTLVQRTLIGATEGVPAPDDRVTIDILAKRVHGAFPPNPYRAG
ncbi:class I SAM-dependent methyltransferase [Elioraea sp.]|uniref:class I SAM-dependent methyltransferase n=1 Tax=Elioraea sp. TaxID=2185103 RepID=UPI0025BD91E6|nr:class I SAM-dependent methyltransferase [Elioraea sp.]